VYLAQNVTTLSARGTIKFVFQGGTASGDNMRGAIRLFQADLASPPALVPSPGVMGLAVMGVVVVIRRSRRG
jgi:small ligand-binding sensory domain FIST